MQFLLVDHSLNTRQTLEVADAQLGAGAVGGGTNGAGTAGGITIGRDEGCTITLRSPFVARRHARILRRGNQLLLEPLCRSGTRVANREIEPGTTARLDFGDEVQIGQFSLSPIGRGDGTVGGGGAGAGAGAGAMRSQRDRAMHEQLMRFEQAVHGALLERLNLRVTGGKVAQATSGSGGPAAAEAFRAQIEQQLVGILGEKLPRLPQPLVLYVVRTHLHRLVIAEVVRQCQGKVQTEYREAGGPAHDAEASQQVNELVSSIVDLMPLIFDPESVNEDLTVAEESFDELFEQHAAGIGPELRHAMVRSVIAKDMHDILTGYGPLTDLLAMPSVSEIMIVGKDRVYIEKNGVIQPTTRGFFSDEVLLAVIERMLSPVGRRVDTSTPLVDARLLDGSRVNVVINPLSLVGPCVTIRKFGWVPFTMDDLIDRGSINDRTARFLQGCIVGKKNIVITGGTGSGKTTLLNVLSAYARPSERIVTIEESAELQLPQPHVVRLEGRPANVEGRGAYTIRDLVRNALRMRPDRIIVGEVRGAEAMDMLQAMNTGHDGSLSTLHANSPEDAMKRLEALVLMAVDMPVRAIREQIVSAVDLLVQITRFADGRRRVTHISEITEIDRDSGELRLEHIFTLKHAGQDALRHTGYIPTFAEAMIEKGQVKVDVFL